MVGAPALDIGDAPQGAPSAFHSAPTNRRCQGASAVSDFWPLPARSARSRVPAWACTSEPMNLSPSCASTGMSCSVRNTASARSRARSGCVVRKRIEVKRRVPGSFGLIAQADMLQRAPGFRELIDAHGIEHLALLARRLRARDRHGGPCLGVFDEVVHGTMRPVTCPGLLVARSPLMVQRSRLRRHWSRRA